MYLERKDIIFSEQVERGGFLSPKKTEYDIIYGKRILVPEGGFR